MTYSPVTRLLTALDLLQSRSSVTATQLAERLSVETRSVRRYITMLQDMGIPIEAERGRYGGYRLRPGFKLPPLMWTEGEALAVTLGLQAVQQLGLSQALPTIESALAKVERVLPPNLRERVQAMQEKIILDLHADGENDLQRDSYLMILSTAAHQGKRVRMRYQARQNEQNERNFDCYGLVYHNRRWYAIGYCHLRLSIRMFRLDRIQELEMLEEGFTPPANFDSLAYAIQTITNIPSRWLIEVLIQGKLEHLRRRVPAEFATLEETPAGILLRAGDDDLQHAARFLINLDCPFRVLQPPELLEALRQLARSILATIDNDF
ncbi:MAG TPA: YafY family protein [Ktedonobacteraceae bacterium]|nr:YafY family protein [Ktedonobacteraceae bacterium]